MLYYNVTKRLASQGTSTMPSVRLRLPIALLALVALTAPAWAEEDEQRGVKYEIGNLSLNLMLDAAIGGYRASNTNFGIGTTSVDANGQRMGTRRWGEYFIKPSLGIEYDLQGAGVAYGLFSVIGAGTRGDGDAANPSATAGRPERLQLEDAAIGWKSGDVFSGLGENALDLSVGQQSIRVGDGFMILEGTANGGRRGAPVLGPRTAFEQTAVARINTQPVRADLFRARAVVDQTLTRDADSPHSEFVGANVEWFASSHLDHGRLEYDERLWYVGLMALRFTEADSTGGRNFSFANGGNGSALGANRDGLNVYSARVGGAILPMLPDYSLYGEYGVQRNSEALRKVRANAWYIEPQYKLSMLPWTPRLSYRYGRFSGDGNPNDQTDKSWDPLFPGNGPRGIGTWTQGEIYGRYTGLGNSNLNVHQIHLKAVPIEDTLRLGAILYRFDYNEPQQTAGVTQKGIMDEVNLYAEWETPVKGLTVIPLVGAGKPRDGIKQTLGTADANGRTVWLAQIAAAFSF
jgi:hypothetical protein